MKMRLKQFQQNGWASETYAFDNLIYLTVSIVLTTLIWMISFFYRLK